MEEVIKKVNGVEVRISDPGANNTAILLLIKDGPSMYLPKATREIENYLEDARMLIDIMSSGEELLNVCGCGCNPLGVTILTNIMWLLINIGRYNGNGNNGTDDAFIKAYNNVLSLYWESE